MATFQTFEDIEAWQRSRELTKSIYKITSQGTFARDFGLRDQIRKASVSIMSNIAEGFERSGTREFIRFCRQLRDQRVKCERSCMLPLIKVISSKQSLTTLANR